MSTIQQQENTTQQDPEPAATGTSAGGELRVVPIDAVSIREGFNPRTTRDPEAFGRTAFSVRESGILTPILVTPIVPDAQTFYLVAGEGRYRAAQEAGLRQIPILICQVDARTGGLELALAENMAREDLDPVAVACGFQRLKAVGWSKRQIAEHLSVTQKLVTERLQILQIPAPLHPQIASGEIPLSAVRPLARLAQIHDGLPAVLVARVLHGSPAVAWEQPLDWPAAVEDPIGALTARYEGRGTELPTGVYDVGGEYRIVDLPQPEISRKDLEALAKLRGVEVSDVLLRFARDELDQAKALRTAFSDERGFSHLIVGDDVVAQLVADRLKIQLKQARSAARIARRESTPSPEADETATAERSGGQLTPEQQTEQRRLERQERLEEQRLARIYNEELGAAIVRHLIRLKLDERLLRVLIATQPLDDLGGLALRGARYTLPGWVVEETTPSGKRKVVFADRQTSTRKALEFLTGASTVGEITGRLFCLIAAARYADERAVAVSARAPYAVPEPDQRPWKTAVVDLIDDICRDRLPEHLTQAARAARRADRQAEQRNRAREVGARSRLKGIEDRLDQLDQAGRTQALRDAQLVYGPYGPGLWELRQKLAAVDAHPRQTAKGQPDPGNAAESDATAAAPDEGASEQTDHDPSKSVADVSGKRREHAAA